MQRPARIVLLSIDLVVILLATGRLVLQAGLRFADIWLVLSASCLTLSLISYIRRSEGTDHYLVSTITALALCLLLTFSK